MSAHLKVGLPVLVVSALVAAINLWASRAFPDEWGGPNIGGGAIQLLAYAGIVAGVTLLIIAAAHRRRNRPTR